VEEKYQMTSESFVFMDANPQSLVLLPCRLSSDRAPCSDGDILSTLKRAVLRGLVSVLKVQYNKSWCFAPILCHRNITSTSYKQNVPRLRKELWGGLQVLVGTKWCCCWYESA